MSEVKAATDGGGPGGRVRQLRLDLPDPPPRYDPASFVVTGSNQAAYELGLALARSAEPAIVIAGARASGKSHFLHLLADKIGSPVLSAADAFAGGAAPTGDAQRLAIDDCDVAMDPRRTLEFFERARIGGARLMLAGAAPIASWAHGLRDLETRLAAMPAVVLGEPDEDLLAAVIRQNFATRQLKFGPGVASYAAPRIPRTFEAASAFAEAAAGLAADHSRPINLAIAKNAIGRLFGDRDSP